jgi:anti-anti-sigma factor
MGVSSRFAPGTETLVLEVFGSFDFPTCKACLRAWRKGGASRPRRLVIDMRRAESIDSSALGLILFLQDKAAAASAELEVANCPRPIEEMMQIAGLQTRVRITALQGPDNHRRSSSE